MKGHLLITNLSKSLIFCFASERSFEKLVSDLEWKERLDIKWCKHTYSSLSPYWTQPHRVHSSLAICNIEVNQGRTLGWNTTFLVIVQREYWNALTSSYFPPCISPIDPCKTWDPLQAFNSHLEYHSTMTTVPIDLLCLLFQLLLQFMIIRMLSECLYTTLQRKKYILRWEEWFRHFSTLPAHTYIFPSTRGAISPRGDITPYSFFPEGKRSGWPERGTWKLDIYIRNSITLVYNVYVNYKRQCGESKVEPNEENKYGLINFVRVLTSLWL